MKPLNTLAAVMCLLSITSVQASPAVDTLLADYRQQGVTDFNAEAGRQLWNREFKSEAGKTRSCATCHSDDPRRVGKDRKSVV